MIDTATLTDWQGRPYWVEVAFVRFLGGYIVWIDDDPLWEGEPYPTRQAAWRAAREALS